MPRRMKPRRPRVWREFGHALLGKSLKKAGNFGIGGLVGVAQGSFIICAIICDSRPGPHPSFAELDNDPRTDPFLLGAAL